MRLANVGVIILGLLALSSTSHGSLDLTSGLTSVLDSLVGTIGLTTDFGTLLYDLLNVVKVPSILLDAVVNLANLIVPSELPEIDFNVWWDVDNTTVDESIREKKITFSPEMISLLKSRLATRMPLNPPLIGVNSTYGLDTRFVEEILDYWQNEYDFAAREQRLNKYPLYVTNIQGLDITFYRISPAETDECKSIIPILLLHGWPQLNLEFFSIVDMLTTPNSTYDFVFDVILPSHPGYAYSEYADMPGLAPYQIGHLYKTLMARLGYDQFIIHSGDMGNYIGNAMTTLFPETVIGFHTTLAHSLRPSSLVKFIVGALEPSLVVEPEYEERMYPLFNYLYFYLLETGYTHMHTTRPDNLSGMRDSPVGLASWVLYVFSIYTDPNIVNLGQKTILDFYDIDELLDVLTVIWDSQCFVNAARLYSQTLGYISNPKEYFVEIFPTEVPFANLEFRYEALYMSNYLIKDKYKNIVHSTTYQFGGHFASMENPDLLAADIYESVSAFLAARASK